MRRFGEDSGRRRSVRGRGNGLFRGPLARRLRCRRSILVSRRHRLLGGLLGWGLLRRRGRAGPFGGRRGCRRFVGRQVRRLRGSVPAGHDWGCRLLGRRLCIDSHGLDDRSSLGTAWRTGRSYGCASSPGGRRRIGRIWRIGYWLVGCVGLVIEHPYSSATRVTAPSSFAAPAQLGCGSLRRRWEAASAPAVWLPQSAVARRGGASAHFEQRPVTSLRPSRSSAPGTRTRASIPHVQAALVHQRDGGALEGGSSSSPVARLSVPWRRRVNRTSVGRKSGVSRLRAATTSSGLTSGAE